MLFSCKITHSVISYLDRRGEGLELLYDKCDWPLEFLRDPSSWLEAEKMENLLRLIDGDFGRNETNGESLIAQVGHGCKDLRSWGVLDSVLRMVQTPKDLFGQPERFLSYFISPAPPIGELKRAPDSVSFVLPISELQFPYVTNYLRAAFEALPTYINKPMASVRWEESQVLISWSERQVSLFSSAENEELSLRPELVRNILMNLESSQRELEQAKKELLDKDQEIEKLRQTDPHAGNSGSLNLSSTASSGSANSSVQFDFGSVAQSLELEISDPISGVLNELYRVGDYLARGQQLVTLLIGQGRSTPQVQEAMRRVDWPLVAKQSPQLIKQAIEGLQSIKETVSQLKTLHELQSAALRAGPTAAGTYGTEAPGPRVDSDLNQLVERAIANVEASVESLGNARYSHLNRTPLKIDRHLLLDRDVAVMPARIEQAMTNLLSSSVDSLRPGDSIRIVTRPNGAHAQIEISDNGDAWLESAPKLALALAQSIIRMHDGSMTVTSRPNHGTTVLIDLPLS